MNSIPSDSEPFSFRHLDYVIAVAETGRTAAAIATIAAIQDLLIAGPPDPMRRALFWAVRPQISKLRPAIARLGHRRFVRTLPVGGGLPAALAQAPDQFREHRAQALDRGGLVGHLGRLAA